MADLLVAIRLFRVGMYIYIYIFFFGGGVYFICIKNNGIFIYFLNSYMFFLGGRYFICIKNIFYLFLK